ncbi:MAG TPA: FHA domain-containing protein [Candidatus Brocadiia bacterium]|nr:FHA domain-containing protein [Candidatus Brocadiia bacterium]
MGKGEGSAPLQIPGYKLLKRTADSPTSISALAKNEKTGEKVVVTIMRGKTMKDVGFAAKFMEVMGRVKKFEHPNVTKLIEAARTTTFTYLVWECVEGNTLEEIFKQKGRYQEGETIPILNGMTKAVEALRKADLTHGDIRLGTVMVTPEGNIKLLDPCVERSARGEFDNPEDSGVRGQGGPNWGVDMNGMGLIAFTLLSGSIPTPPEGVPIRDYVVDQIGNLKGGGASVSDYMCNIIRRLLARKPGEGFKTPAELLIELVSAKIFGRQSIPTMLTAKEKEAARDEKAKAENLEKAKEVSGKFLKAEESGISSKKKKRRIIILEEGEDEDEVLAQIAAEENAEEVVKTSNKLQVAKVEQTQEQPIDFHEETVKTVPEEQAKEVISSDGLATVDDISLAMKPVKSEKSDHATFYIWQDDWRGMFFVLKEGQEVSLGRDSTQADIMVMDSKVSRRHCTLSFKEGKVTVTDLDSANGTYVNLKKIKEVVLSPTDKVRVGLTNIQQDLDVESAPKAEEMAKRAREHEASVKTKG